MRQSILAMLLMTGCAGGALPLPAQECHQSSGCNATYSPDGTFQLIAGAEPKQTVIVLGGDRLNAVTSFPSRSETAILVSSPNDNPCYLSGTVAMTWPDVHAADRTHSSRWEMTINLRCPSDEFELKQDFFGHSLGY